MHFTLVTVGDLAAGTGSKLPVDLAVAYSKCKPLIFFFVYRRCLQCNIHTMQYKNIEKKSLALQGEREYISTKAFKIMHYEIDKQTVQVQFHVKIAVLPYYKILNYACQSNAGSILIISNVLIKYMTKKVTQS